MTIFLIINNPTFLPFVENHLSKWIKEMGLNLVTFSPYHFPFKLEFFPFWIRLFHPKMIILPEMMNEIKDFSIPLITPFNFSKMFPFSFIDSSPDPSIENLVSGKAGNVITIIDQIPPPLEKISPSHKIIHISSTPYIDDRITPILSVDDPNFLLSKTKILISQSSSSFHPLIPLALQYGVIVISPFLSPYQKEEISLDDVDSILNSETLMKYYSTKSKKCFYTHFSEDVIQRDWQKILSTIDRKAIEISYPKDLEFIVDEIKKDFPIVTKLSSSSPNININNSFIIPDFSKIPKDDLYRYRDKRLLSCSRKDQGEYIGLPKLILRGEYWNLDFMCNGNDENCSDICSAFIKMKTEINDESKLYIFGKEKVISEHSDIIYEKIPSSDNRLLIYLPRIRDSFNRELYHLSFSDVITFDDNELIEGEMVCNDDRKIDIDLLSKLLGQDRDEGGVKVRENNFRKDVLIKLLLLR